MTGDDIPGDDWQPAPQGSPEWPRLLPPERLALSLRPPARIGGEHLYKSLLRAAIHCDVCPRCAGNGYWRGPRAGIGITAVCRNRKCRARFVCFIVPGFDGVGTLLAVEDVTPEAPGGYVFTTERRGDDA